MRSETYEAVLFHPVQGEKTCIWFPELAFGGLTWHGGG